MSVFAATGLGTSNTRGKRTAYVCVYAHAHAYAYALLRIHSLLLVLIVLLSYNECAHRQISISLFSRIILKYRKDEEAYIRICQGLNI